MLVWSENKQNAELKGQTSPPQPLFFFNQVFKTDYIFSFLAWLPQDTNITNNFWTQNFTAPLVHTNQLICVWSSYADQQTKGIWEGKTERWSSRRTQNISARKWVLWILPPKNQMNSHMLLTCKAVKRSWTTPELVTQLVLLLNSAELDAALAEVHRWGWGSAVLKQAAKRSH